jgi:hypothetical protein
MLSLSGRWLMFLSAYSPLLLLFGLVDSFGSIWSRNLCLALAALGLGAMLVFMRMVKKLGSRDISISRANPRNIDAVAHVITYLVPFLAPSTSSEQGVIRGSPAPKRPANPLDAASPFTLSSTFFHSTPKGGLASR